MQPSTRKEQLEELWDNFQSIKRKLAPPGIPGAAADITGSQLMVLRLLHIKGDRTIKEVAHTLGISSSAATQLVHGLVHSGYVVRQESAADRRSVRLNLSKKSQGQIVKRRKETQKRLLKIFDVLTDRELTQYLQLNKKIAATVLKK